MTTTPHNTALMTDAQLDAVAGGIDTGPVFYEHRSSRVTLPPAGWVSIAPIPSFTPRPRGPVDPPFRPRR